MTDEPKHKCFEERQPDCPFGWTPAVGWAVLTAQGSTDVTAVRIGKIDFCPYCGEALSARAQTAELGRAVEDVERDHPLPRCRHGAALRDHSGEVLVPPCGCRLRPVIDRHAPRMRGRR